MALKEVVNVTSGVHGSTTNTLDIPCTVEGDSLVLPPCTLPPKEEYDPVEAFVSRAIEERSAGSTSIDGYKAILDCLRKRDDANMLRKILLALRGSTLHHLSTANKHAHLLHLVFRLDPFTRISLDSQLASEENEPPKKRLKKSDSNTSRSDEDEATDFALADAHLHLIVAMVSANSIFLTPATNALWRMLTTTRNAPPQQVARVHAALCTMLRLCPKAKSDLFPVLKNNFPYKMSVPAEQQVWYAKHCLAVVKYVPTLHGQVLELLVDKCLEMDVEIKINDGGHVSIEAECPEEEATQESEHTDKSLIKKESKNWDKVDEMAEKLDSLMEVIFNHIKDYSQKGQSAGRELYRMLSPVFGSSILTTHRSKFVQFVVFLVCGLDPSDVTLQREFAAKLIDTIIDPHRATVTRQSSACYLASFVSRAKYVCPETACEAISALLQWAEAYINAIASDEVVFADKRQQCEMHSLFYTVCQGAFYIMCFRGAEAFKYHQDAVKYHAAHNVDDNESEKHPYPHLFHIDISKTRWGRLCRHRFNPLRYCLESVRGEFLHVADVYGLLDKELLETLVTESKQMSSKLLRRKSSLISTAATLAAKRRKGGVGGLGRGSNPLDSFFPFDPYLLRLSHSHIQPLYRNWEDIVAAALEDPPDAELQSVNDVTSENEPESEDEEEEEEVHGQVEILGIPDELEQADFAVEQNNPEQESLDNPVSRKRTRSRAQSVESYGSW